MADRFRAHVEPPREEVLGDIRRELGEGLVVPVLIGSAEGDNGVRRLLKSLRHDGPEVTVAAARAGIGEGADAVVQILKTFHGGHGGKRSLVRVLRGSLKDGAVLHGEGGREGRIAGIFALCGDKQIKRHGAQAGHTVALDRLRAGLPGDTGMVAQSHFQGHRNARLLLDARQYAAAGQGWRVVDSRKMGQSDA